MIVKQSTSRSSTLLR